MSGSGKGREQLARLSELLDEAGIGHTSIDSIDDLRQQTATAENPVVVSAGGDGTISLAASICPPATPIVPMPLGTENLLAREFGHLAAAESVLRTIRYGQPYPLDAGTANGRTFLIMATCGFDAEVVRGMHLTRRGHINRWSYFRPILRALRKYSFPNIQVQIDNHEPISGCWVMVFNLPRYAANLDIEPAAVGNDGALDVIVLQRGSILSGVKYLFGVWTGRHLHFQDVIRQSGKSVRITSQTRVPYEMDGDYVGRLPLQIDTLPHHVLLLLPPEKAN